MTERHTQRNLDEVLMSFRPRVAAFLSRITWDAPEVDDLVQETLIKVSRGWEGFRGDSSLSSWIFQIASNVAKDYFRANSIRPQPAKEEKDVKAPESTGILTQLETAETGACVKNGISILPESYRRILIRYYMDGESMKEIAVAESASEQSVKVRLHRARERFRISCVSSCDVSRTESGDLACGPKARNRSSKDGCGN